MRRLLLLGIGLLPLALFGFANDALAGQTDGINGEGGRPFTTTLLGANEVPAPIPPSNLTGTAKVTINLGQSELCWDLDYTAPGQTVVAAHIHKGVAGTAPPNNIVFPFFNPPSAPVNSGCRQANPALLHAIVEDPAGYYVNIHTKAHPAGAGRGQLTK